MDYSPWREELSSFSVPNKMGLLTRPLILQSEIVRVKDSNPAFLTPPSCFLCSSPESPAFDNKAQRVRDNSILPEALTSGRLGSMMATGQWRIISRGSTLPPPLAESRQLLWILELARLRVVKNPRWLWSQIIPLWAAIIDHRQVWMHWPSLDTFDTLKWESLLVCLGTTLFSPFHTPITRHKNTRARSHADTHTWHTQWKMEIGKLDFGVFHAVSSCGYFKASVKPYK